MQLSILLATNRTGLLACSRIAQACSWAGPDIEVIVRDNSGDAQKRELLAHFRRDHCNIVIAEPCDVLTNFSEILRLAKGDFVFVLADDDFCFDHAIAALPGVIEQFGEDPSVVGVTGAYARRNVARVVDHQLQRTSTRTTLRRAWPGYLSYAGPNILHYAPMRREIVQRVFGFMNAMPVLFFVSRSDYLPALFAQWKIRPAASGFLYLYDVGSGRRPKPRRSATSISTSEAGLDPAINKLHWFLCGFEGAVLVRNSDVFPDYPLAQRQAIADRWFSTMFTRFKGHARLTFDSPFHGRSRQSCARNC